MFVEVRKAICSKEWRNMNEVWLPMTSTPLWFIDTVFPNGGAGLAQLVWFGLV